MIRYSLKCSCGNAFESWFQSASAFEGLKAARQLSCPLCGEGEIEKSLMSPSVPAKENARPPESHPRTADLSDEDRRKAIAALKKKVEAESDYVGLSFATEARAMHVGDKPERAIYGEAKLEEARELLEDGIPVAPLPFTPSRKTH